MDNFYVLGSNLSFPIHRLVTWLAAGTIYVGDIQLFRQQENSQRSRVNLIQSQRGLYIYNLIDRNHQNP